METGILSIGGFKQTIGVGYVSIPSDLERADYIRDCFLNSQISFRTEDGGFYNRVPVPPDVLNFLEFPQELEQLGSPIIYATEEKFQQPVVIARLQMREALGDGKESQFKFRRMVDDRMVEINGSAKDGIINLIVDGGDQSGQVNINVYNQANDCKLAVDISGDVEVTSHGKVVFNQQETFESITTDQESGDSASFVQTTNQNQFKNEKLVINEGEDPLTLGNELKKFLGEFVDEVSNITVATAIGTQPILNKIQVLNLKTKLDSFLSKVAFIDK